MDALSKDRGRILGSLREREQLGPLFVEVVGRTIPMDPLARVTLVLRKGPARVSGTVLSASFAGYLTWWASRHSAHLVDWMVFGSLVLSLGIQLYGRLTSERTRVSFWQELSLFTHCVVLAHVWVINSAGQLDGPQHPVVYLVLMLVAGFSRPAVSASVLGFTVLLQAAIGHFAMGWGDLNPLWPRALLMGFFVFLNLALFRAEMARVRRLSRSKVESELRRLKEAARSYRLLSTPTGAGTSRPSRSNDAEEDRLLHSGVEEIHAALRLALELLRQSLELQSAALLWLSPSGKELHVQALVTDYPSVTGGPFGALDGICGAALTQRVPVSLVGAQAGGHVPYYANPPRVGAVCAVPVIEHQHVLGVLVVDREQKTPFTSVEEELLVQSTQFMLRTIENERVFIQLERAKSEQGKLYRAAGALSAATTEAQVIEAGVNSAREVAAFDFSVVTLFDRDLNEHEICAVSGEGSAELVGQRFRHNSGLVSMVVANCHALPFRGDYDPAHQVVFTRRIHPPSMPSLLVLPLVVHERALGTLVLGSHRSGVFGDAVRPTLEVMASHLAVSLANARMLKRLEELATTDGLTGVYNKRALIDQAQKKLKSAVRYKKPLAILVSDIDHFKKVNDTYGHDVGDVVIKGMADVLMRVKRDTDIVGRFGGEEFVVVCEETDASGAALLAERIRTELAATSFHSEQGPVIVTCSVGVAPFPVAGETWEALFKATDEALYVSKRSGRNRVTVWSPKLQGCAA